MVAGLAGFGGASSNGGYSPSDVSPTAYVKGITATNDELPQTDLIRGTTFQRMDAMFVNFQDGSIFTFDEAEASDMRDMLKKYGKGSQIEQALTLPLMGLDWEIKKPATGDKGQTKWFTEFLGRASNQGGMSTPMDLIVGQMTSAVTYKKAYFEKVFEVDDDGSYVYDQVAFRPASTCQVRRDPATAAFLGFQQNPVTLAQQQQSGLLPIRIEPKYSFVYIHGQHRDPINGLSLLEIPYWCFKIQEKIMFLWFSFLEQQSLPRTIVEANDVGTATAIASKVAGLKNSGVLPVANNAGAQSNRNMVYTLDSSGKGAAQFLEAISWLDQTALDSQLVGFTGLASAAANGRGSNALADTMSNFSLKSRQVDVREMEYCINNWLLPDLIRYNFGPDASVPKLKFAPLVEADLQISMGLLDSMASRAAVQVFPDEFINELVLNVSRYLGLDTEKIGSNLKSAQALAVQSALAQGLPTQVATAVGVGQAVNAAHAAVAARQAETAPPVVPPAANGAPGVLPTR